MLRVGRELWTLLDWMIGADRAGVVLYESEGGSGGWRDAAWFGEGVGWGRWEGVLSGGRWVSEIFGGE